MDNFLKKLAILLEIVVLLMKIMFRSQDFLLKMSKT